MANARKTRKLCPKVKGFWVLLERKTRSLQSWLISFKRISKSSVLWSLQSVWKRKYICATKIPCTNFQNIICGKTQHLLCCMKNLFSLLETQYDKFWQAEWFPVSDAFGKAEMLNKKLALNLHPPSTQFQLQQLRGKEMLVEVRSLFGQESVMN